MQSNNEKMPFTNNGTAPLIRVEQREGEQVVSARELHDFLEVKTDFSKWCERMFEYGFVENQDYVKVSVKNDDNSKGGRSNLIDYALTLDCAKEIAMLQRTEKGKQARQYFLDCEKTLKEAQTKLSPAELVLQNAQALVAQERRLAEVELRQKALEESFHEEKKDKYLNSLITFQDYRSSTEDVFFSNYGKRFTEKQWSEIEVLAAKMEKENGESEKFKKINAESIRLFRMEYLHKALYIVFTEGGSHE